MNRVETGVLIAFAGQLDPRILPANADDVAVKAQAWYEILFDVTPEMAKAAVVNHYIDSRDPIMIADIVEFHRRNRWREELPDTSDYAERRQLRPAPRTASEPRRPSMDWDDGKTKAF